MPSSTPTKLAVILGGVPRTPRTRPDRRVRDSLRVFFDKEFRSAFIRMTAELPRKGRANAPFYEIRRDGDRNDRPWARLLRSVDDAVIAGAPRERVEALADLLRAYVTARLNERPETAAEAMVTDMDIAAELERRAA